MTRAVVIPVGDARRSVVGHAIFAVLLAGAVFSLVTGPVKQIEPLYGHAPWLNDPFDTIVSFSMFFVPLIALCCLARVSLCRKSEPLPVLRVHDLLRGCRVLLAAMGATLLSEWIALAIGENRAQWNGATVLQVALVFGATALVCRGVVLLRVASTLSLDGTSRQEPPSDWLSDLVAVAQVQSQRLGPLTGSARGFLSWVNHHPVRAVRRHPVWTAVLGCSGFGAAVMVNQGIREGYNAPSTLLAVVLLTCGMFGLLVASGAYIGLVRSESPLVGRQRRFIDAAVVTSIGILIPFAFRYHLWWIVSSTNSSAGIPQLAAMLGICAVLIFATTLSVESLLGLHSRDVTGSHWPSP